MKRLLIKAYIDEQTAREIIQEADSMYWLRSYAAEWNPHSCVLTLLTPKGDATFDVLAKRARISARSIANAMTLMLSSTEPDLRAISARILGDIDYDGRTCDAVLQFAVFGNVIYS